MMKKLEIRNRIKINSTTTKEINMKLNQRQAVYEAVKSVFNEAEMKFEDGVDAKSVMTKEHRAQVNAILCLGFINGAIELKDTKSNRAKLTNDSLLKEYVSGLQSNWLNKDPRLNGGVDHETKNPGSRTGTTDPQIKALKALLSTLTKESDRTEIQGLIDTRIQMLKPTKETTIDYSALPEDIRAKYAK